MEKVIYLVWRKPDAEPETFEGRLRITAARALLAAGARGLRLNVADAAVAPAVGLRQTYLKPPPDALVQIWVDSAIAALRAPMDAAVAAQASRSAAYLVTESQPLRNALHPPRANERTEGFSQIALLRRPPRLGYEAWLDTWHNFHTPVARETQSHFEYVQNVVVRPLTAEAPPLDAVVEECFPAAAMTDPYVFFDAPGDETKFRRNLERMMDSVHRFIDLATIDVIPTSQYQLFG